MTFGIESILPTEFEVPTYRTLDPRRLSAHESQGLRVAEFDQFEEGRLLALQQNIETQGKRKETYDRKLKPSHIRAGDLVLLYDNRRLKFASKFGTDWLGPFRVQRKYDNGSFELETLDGTPLQTRVNKERIKLYKVQPPT